MNAPDQYANGPYRVVIGATRRDWLPAKVLECTIRESCSIEDLEIIHTFGEDWTWPGGTPQMNLTGFSLVRFCVPELCGFRGRAVYLDSDMIVLRNIAELLCHPFGQAAVLAPRNMASVILYDCARLPHWSRRAVLDLILSGGCDYHKAVELEYEPLAARTLPGNWNCLDERPHGAALVHFTKIRTQPWRTSGHPLSGLWFDALRLSIARRIITPEEVGREAALGHVTRETFSHIGT